MKLDPFVNYESLISLLIMKVNEFVDYGSWASLSTMKVWQVCKLCKYEMCEKFERMYAPSAMNKNPICLFDIFREYVLI